MIRRRSELPRVVDLTRALGDALDQRGDRAWNLTREWTAGPRASTLEAGRSRTLGDPTGTAAIALEVDPHAAYLRRLDRLTALAVELLEFLRDVGPDPRASCQWHRAAGHYAPATRRHGPDLVCEWCYRRHRSTGRPPTTTEITRRATGARRIPRTTP